MLNIDSLRKHNAQIRHGLRVDLDNLLPEKLNFNKEGLDRIAKESRYQGKPSRRQWKRESIIDLFARVVAEAEIALYNDWVPLKYETAKLTKAINQSTKEMRTLEKLLCELETQFDQASMTTLYTISCEMEEKGLDPKDVENALNILLQIVKEGAKYPIRKLPQGNTIKPLGVYILTIWDVLSVMGIDKMRPASNIIVKLLSRLPQYKKASHTKLIEICYQTIRNQEKSKVTK